VGTFFLLWNAFTSAFFNPYKRGWAWSVEDALSLYGTYTMAVYFTPVIGGLLADRYLGYRWAVILGALAMTLDMHLAETPLFISELDF
jgi:POT family proton-dependent oligopeptide transporter